MLISRMTSTIRSYQESKLLKVHSQMKKIQQGLNERKTNKNSNETETKSQHCKQDPSEKSSNFEYGNSRHKPKLEDSTKKHPNDTLMRESTSHSRNCSPTQNSNATIQSTHENSTSSPEGFRITKLRSTPTLPDSPISDIRLTTKKSDSINVSLSNNGSDWGTFRNRENVSNAVSDVSEDSFFVGNGLIKVS